MQNLELGDIKELFHCWKQVMDENRDRLIELDNALGDGDLGLTMTRAFTAADEEASGSSETSPGKLLMKAGMIMAKTAPSTMGTLVATGFMLGGKAIGNATTIATSELAVFFRAFVEGVMERGKTKPGNKTIVDSLHPAADKLEQAAANDTPLAKALSQAGAAAEKGVEAAKGMQAQHGRAAYYREQSVGVDDPGAIVGLLIVNAMSDYLQALGAERR